MLFVDDEAGQLELGREWLAAAGYRVDICADPAQALDRLADGDHALLISDVTMPGALDGVALAVRAGERYPGLRVLLVSGYTGQHANEDANLARRPLLPKPFTQTDLLYAVRRTLDTK